MPTSVQALVCDSYDNGPGAAVDILRAAPAISCESSLWNGFVRPYGIFSTGVAVGAGDGRGDGAADGVELGEELGREDGVADGVSEGIAVGVAVGCGVTAS